MGLFTPAQTHNQTVTELDKPKVFSALDWTSAPNRVEWNWLPPDKRVKPKVENKKTTTNKQKIQQYYFKARICMLASCISWLLKRWVRCMHSVLFASKWPIKPLASYTKKATPNPFLSLKDAQKCLWSMHFKTTIRMLASCVSWLLKRWVRCMHSVLFASKWPSWPYWGGVV